MASRRGLSIFALVLGFSPGLWADFVNFESGQVRLLALSSDGDHLFALNTPDNRVEIFRVTGEGLSHVGEVVVGLEPVAVGESAPGEIWVVNHLSDSISVVDVSDPSRAFVKATLLVGDEPRDIVFAGENREKAFITTAHRGQSRPGDPQLTTPGVGRADVWVFDVENLSAAPHIVTLFADTSRALAVSPDGTRVYAAAFQSGNRTSVIHELAASADPELNEEIGDGFTGLGMPPLPDDLPNTTGRAPSPSRQTRWRPTTRSPRSLRGRYRGLEHRAAGPGRSPGGVTDGGSTCRPDCRIALLWWVDANGGRPRGRPVRALGAQGVGLGAGVASAQTR